jgi:hypothetical protein
VRTLRSTVQEVVSTGMRKVEARDGLPTALARTSAPLSTGASVSHILSQMVLNYLSAMSHFS